MDESEDLAEALSSRYTDSARVLVLSSGNWAVFNGLGAGQSCRVVRHPEDLVRAIEASCRVAKLEHEQSLEEEARERPSGRSLVSSATAEDLDL